MNLLHHQVLRPPIESALAAGIGVMNQPLRWVGRIWSASPDCLLQGVEGQVGTQRRGHPPADDEPRIGIDHQRRIGEARPGGNIGYVGEPQAVRAGCFEATIHQIGGSGSILIWDGRALPLAPDHAF